MASNLLVVCTTRLLQTAAFTLLLAGTSFSNEKESRAEDPEAESHLVRVNIISEFRGPKGMVELNGKVLNNYSPTIIQDFSSAGVVIDPKSHVMTFLSDRWVDIQSSNPRIEISTNDGKKLQGKLVGIDQRNGVVVIELLAGKLQETLICTQQCFGKDDIIVMAPVAEETGLFKFEETRIVPRNVSVGGPLLESIRVPIEHSFPDISLPILTTDRKVLGFIAGREPMDAGGVVYPIQQLMASAREILRTGRDIQAGWLGIVFQDVPSGVVVHRVEPGSPAQKAGLNPRDFLVRYNNQPVKSARQFIDLLENSSVGSQARIEIKRQGKLMNLTALIEARKAPQIQSRISLSSPRPLIGLDTAVLTPDLADALQMPGQTGLLVVDVIAQMPAKRAGVLEGDVIVAMDGQPIFDAASFATYWQSHGLGSHLILTVLRKGVERSISIPVQIYSTSQ
jgi:S1-C subfamily serine protease